MNITEAAAAAGVSVRTLHYYEEVGMIVPARNEANGYRIYNEEMIRRARMIRAYRELQFSLKEIRLLLDAPRMERDRLLENKINALGEKRRRIDNRIALAQSIRMMGPARLTEIDLAAFDEQMDRSRKYLEQDETARQLTKRLSQLTDQQNEAAAEAILNSVVRIAAVPESAVGEAIQDLITCVENHFYPCTPEILASYARAYGGDGLLAQTVDERGGPGTSQTIQSRIEHWLTARNPLCAATTTAAVQNQ